jgi:UDPglucose 6-dehydrogenase
MEPEELSPVVRKTNIVDGRRCLDARQWIAAGWQYYALGGTPNAVADMVSP